MGGVIERAGGLFAITLALVFAAAPAHGQDAPTERAEEPQERSEEPTDEDAGRDQQARMLFEAGRVAYGNGRYAEALEHFERAHELSGRAALLFNVGSAAQQLRQDERALAAYEAYLEGSPDAPNRTAVEARISLLRASIAEAAAEASGEGAAASTEGAQSAGEATGPDVLAPALLLAGGGAAAVAGAVLLIVAADAAAQVDDAPRDTPWTEVQGSYDDAGTFGVAGGVLLAAGAALAAAGLVWLAVAATEGEDAPVAVGVGPGGLSVRGPL